MMALWKQTHSQQPFTTYRDAKTGQWMIVRDPEPAEDKIVESPVYRDPQTGEWITIKPTLVQSHHR